MPVDVILVWGSPASGKTTHVREHMEQGDLIVDLGPIKKAISMAPKAESSDDLLDIALELREHLFDIVRERRFKSKNAWVIAGLPRLRQRQEIINKINPTRVVHIDANYKTCIRQAHGDESRLNKKLQERIIAKYFGVLET